MSARQVPSLWTPSSIRLPPTSVLRLANGLTVTTAHRSGPGLVELRLRIPVAATSPAVTWLMSRVLWAGVTLDRGAALVDELDMIGGSLRANVNPDRVLISGRCLNDGFGRLCELLGAAVRFPTYTEEHLAPARSRLTGRLRVAESDPQERARSTLLAQVYPHHPYGARTPTVDELAAVTLPEVHKAHVQVLRPDYADLVIVGDLENDVAPDVVESRLGSWQAGERLVSTQVPPMVCGRALTLVDLPEAAESCLRVAYEVVGRSHPDYEPLAMANTLLGGGPGSRLWANLRDDNGYAYAPRSMIEVSEAAAILVMSAETETDTTAEALVALMRESARLRTSTIDEEELNRARRYLLGSLTLSMGTQSGLADLISLHAGQGLPLDYLAGHAARLESTSAVDVHAACERYLAPDSAIPVILGDTTRIDVSGLRAAAARGTAAGRTA